MRKIYLFFAILLSLVSCTPSNLVDRFNSSPNFYLLFEDAQGLTIDTPVMYQGVTIGKVTEVAFVQRSVDPTSKNCQLTPDSVEQFSATEVVCITIQVEAEHTNLIREKSDFSVDNTNGLKLLMATSDVSSPNLPPGTTIVVGTNDLWGQIEQTIQGLFGDVGWDEMAEIISNPEKMAELAQTIMGQLQFWQLTLTTKIEPNGQVTRTYILESPTYLPLEKILPKLVPVEWQPVASEKDGLHFWQASRTFPLLTAVTSHNSTVTITQTNSILSQEFVYTESWYSNQIVNKELSINDALVKIGDMKSAIEECSQILATGLNPASLKLAGACLVILKTLNEIPDYFPLSLVKVHIIVDMPGTIMTDKTQPPVAAIDQQLRWDLTLEELNHGFQVQATSQTNVISGTVGGSSLIWLVLSLLALLGIGGGVIYLVYLYLNRRVPYSNNHEDDPYADYPL